MEAVWLNGLVSIVCALIAAWAAGKRASDEIGHKLEISQAVTDTKIDELTREVREHNNFARRMPVVEEQIKVINRQIEDLENLKG